MLSCFWKAKAGSGAKSDSRYETAAAELHPSERPPPRTRSAPAPGTIPADHLQGRVDIDAKTASGDRGRWYSFIHGLFVRDGSITGTKTFHFTPKRLEGTPPRRTFWPSFGQFYLGTYFARFPAGGGSFRAAGG